MNERPQNPDLYTRRRYQHFYKRVKDAICIKASVRYRVKKEIFIQAIRLLDVNKGRTSRELKTKLTQIRWHAIRVLLITMDAIKPRANNHSPWFLCRPIADKEIKEMWSSIPTEWSTIKEVASAWTNRGKSSSQEEKGTKVPTPNNNPPLDDTRLETTLKSLLTASRKYQGDLLSRLEQLEKNVDEVQQILDGVHGYQNFKRAVAFLRDIKEMVNETETGLPPGQ